MIRPHHDPSQGALSAMQSFLARGDEPAFVQAVALYCIEARNRNDPVEAILATLCRLGEEVAGPRVDTEQFFRPTRMHALIIAGILRAFYGDAAVDRGLGASAQRKADAPQHNKKGTWPNPPAY